MIHIYGVWWLTRSAKLKAKNRNLLENSNELYLSVICLWEVAKAVENGKIQFNIPIEEWLNSAVSTSGIKIIHLNTEIIIDSTQLPGNFHKDPADQLIVSTSRVNNIPLLTQDRKILMYPHVKLCGVDEIR